jgi:hypothetical protein
MTQAIIGITLNISMSQNTKSTAITNTLILGGGGGGGGETIVTIT